jgi:hypothetical protein
MGYCTKFKLKIKNTSPETEEIIWTTIGTMDEANYALGGDDCKWYDYEEDMKALSKEFPDALFELSGEGEESGDIWNAYFKNGKWQRCPAKIVFEPYNEKALK